MKEEELKQMDKEELLGVIKAQQYEIERLNKEIESWIKLIDYKGIEDIPQYVSDLEVDNKQLKEENQLLNKNYNIINELEKWLVERIDEYKEMELYDNASAYEYTLYTLQELKGSDKVE